MPLYWLCCRQNNQISVVIEPGASIIHARMRAGLAGLGEGTFTEAHELDEKTEKRVPKAMIGRRLAQVPSASRPSCPAIYMTRAGPVISTRWVYPGGFAIVSGLMKRMLLTTVGLLRRP
jgi:hypothetical protein